MKLTTRIQKCTLCSELAENRTKVVVGEGPIPSPILFLGDAPGRKEDLTGKPFCGLSGSILEAAAFKAKLHKGIDYHLLNILKCKLPNNRDPHLTELQNCRPFLEAQIKVVKPTVVVALGKCAQAFVLQQSPRKISVIRNMGKIVQHPDFVAILSCHPAFAVRDADVRKALENHFKTARRVSLGGKVKCDVQLVK